MQDGFIIILILVLIAVGIAGAVLAYRQQEQRRKELAGLAARLGWSFSPASEPTDGSVYERFSAFGRGHSRSRFNTLSGPIEVCGRAAQAVMGDFRYKVTSSSGKSTTTRTYTFSYAMIEIPLPGVPDLLIRRENLLDKLAGAIGFDDIDFESEEFSRRFHVKSPDRKFAYDVVHPRMMEFLMAGRMQALDIRDGRMCLTDGARRWTSREFEEALDWAGRFFSHWPDYLTRQLLA